MHQSQSTDLASQYTSSSRNNHRNMHVSRSSSIVISPPHILESSSDFHANGDERIVDTHKAHRNEGFIPDRHSLAESERRALFSPASVESIANPSSPYSNNMRQSPEAMRYSSGSSWQTSEDFGHQSHIPSLSQRQHDDKQRRKELEQQLIREQKIKRNKVTASIGLQSPIVDEEASREFLTSADDGALLSRILELRRELCGFRNQDPSNSNQHDQGRPVSSTIHNNFARSTGLPSPSLARVNTTGLVKSPRRNIANSGWNNTKSNQFELPEHHKQQQQQQQLYSSRRRSTVDSIGDDFSSVASSSWESKSAYRMRSVSADSNDTYNQYNGVQQPSPHIHSINVRKITSPPPQYKQASQSPRHNATHVQMAKSVLSRGGKDSSHSAKSRLSILDDELNERLSQLSMEESLVLEQLDHLAESDTRWSVVNSVRTSFSGVPLVVQGDLDDGDLVLEANAGMATLTSKYSRTIRSLQRGAVLKMVLKRGSNRDAARNHMNESGVLDGAFGNGYTNRSGRRGDVEEGEEESHTVVDVEVKVANQLRDLEWSVVGCKPRKRFAISLTDMTAIMCGGEQEARRMGGLSESTLFRIHLNAASGGGASTGSVEPLPLQFAAASREQQHEWAVGLALLHSFSAMSKQVPVLYG